MTDTTSCPFAKSNMTPCVRRDGPISYAAGRGDAPICVGCERSPLTTGIPAPADWAELVAKHRRRK